MIATGSLLPIDASVIHYCMRMVLNSVRRRENHVALDSRLANRIILSGISDRCNALLDREDSGNGWWNTPSGPWVPSGLPLILFFL